MTQVKKHRPVYEPGYASKTQIHKMGGKFALAAEKGVLAGIFGTETRQKERFKTLYQALATEEPQVTQDLFKEVLQTLDPAFDFETPKLSYALMKRLNEEIQKIQDMKTTGEKFSLHEIFNVLKLPETDRPQLFKNRAEQIAERKMIDTFNRVISEERAGIDQVKNINGLFSEINRTLYHMMDPEFRTWADDKLPQNEKIKILEDFTTKNISKTKQKSPDKGCVLEFKFHWNGRNFDNKTASVGYTHTTQQIESIRQATEKALDVYKKTLTAENVEV